MERQSGLPLYRGRFGDTASAAEAIDLVDKVQAIVTREKTIRQNENIAIRQSTKKSYLQFAAVLGAVSLIGAAVTLGGPILAKKFADSRIDKRGHT
jgi:hypothetical protein